MDFSPGHISFSTSHTDLRRLRILLPSDNRLAFAAHNLARDLDVGDAGVVRRVEHHVEHQLLDQPAQRPRARAFFQRLRRQFRCV